MKCHCNPAEVKAQEYQRAVPVVVPSFIDLGRKTVCIHACLVSEIWDLWRKGIRTTGSCCGHNQYPEAYIGVEQADIPKMEALGYEVALNPTDPARRDSFIPKSLTS